MTNQLMEFASLLGAGSFSEVFFEQTSSRVFVWENGGLEKTNFIEESGAGLRYLSGEETRFGSVSLGKFFDHGISSDEKDSLQAAQRRLTDGLSPSSPRGLSLPIKKNHPIQVSSLAISSDEKKTLLERGDKAARAAGDLKQVSLTLGEKSRTIFYLNSEGTSFWEERPYLVFNVRVAAEKNGGLQTGYESIGGLWGWEKLTVEVIERACRLAAERALKKCLAPPAPSGTMPVILAAEAGGTLIHEAVGHSLEADAVLEGTSPAYAGKTGEAVANPKLTVYDNPTLEGKRGSFYFDDEGTPADATRAIENGVLKTLLYDRISAGKAGVTSNGHGRRESFAHIPIPRMSNTYIAPGPDNPEEILSSVKDGFLVTRMGGGQVNTANSDFVFEVEEGFLLRGGKKTLVRGATLLGNGPRVLADIDLVGSDHGWGIGTCGKEGQGVPVSDAIPTLRIKSLVIGGTG